MTNNFGAAISDNEEGSDIELDTTTASSKKSTRERKKAVSYKLAEEDMDEDEDIPAADVKPDVGEEGEDDEEEGEEDEELYGTPYTHISESTISDGFLAT